MEEILKIVLLITASIVVFNMLTFLYNSITNLLKTKFKKLKTKIICLKKAKEINKRKQREFIYRYYGLFEFEIKECEYSDDLKKDYCAIMKEKIKEKYKYTDLSLTATDKIFFNSGDFSSFENLIDDFLKLFSYFADINKKRQIKTYLKLSIWSDYGKVTLQEAYKVLAELNNSNFLNQVMINKPVYEELEKQRLHLFNINPAGLMLSSFSDKEFELYKLARKEQK